jgi:hypothetical protein
MKKLMGEIKAAIMWVFEILIFIPLIIFLIISLRKEYKDHNKNYD